MRNIFILLLIIFLNPAPAMAREYLYILNDKCINELYDYAKQTLESSNIAVIRDPQGIILRFQLIDPQKEYKQLTGDTNKKIHSIISFLAKIENPAIIEVHMEDIPKEHLGGRKNWEVSTIIANKIESAILSSLDFERIYSVGYGEFLPSKNTSNNGVNYPNRVDIMIICNISGE